MILDVWQGKDLRAQISDVWQLKDLGGRRLNRVNMAKDIIPATD